MERHGDGLDRRTATAVFRIDGRLDMARFYVLIVSGTLFGDPALVRCWGRIGTAGRVRIDLFPTAGEAEVAKARLLASKLRRGYRPGRSAGAKACRLRPKPSCAGQAELPL